MKKLLSNLIPLLMVFFIIGTGCGQKNAPDNSLQKIEEKGYFVVGLDEHFPPMGFRDDTGEIVGFDIDLAKSAAEKMGLDVRFKPVKWEEIILKLNDKDIDVIWNGLSVTAERAEQIAFSDVYLANRQIIIVPENSVIKNSRDLEGRITGVQAGSSSEQISNEELLTQVVRYSDNTAALSALNSGEIDAVVMDEIAGRFYLTRIYGNFQILEEYLAEEYYAAGFRKADDAFRNELNKILTQMKEDGSAAEISQKWFGKDILVK
jgi:polar amino acid transport system substrate-binding protein